MKLNFKIATFNVQRGYYQSVIFQDLKTLIKKTPEFIPDIFLLQEIPYDSKGESVFLDQFMTILGPSFKCLKATSSTHYKGIHDGIALLYRDTFEVLDHETLPLPPSPVLPWTERILKKGRHSPEEKVMQMVTFRKEDRIFRVGNIHVDCYGGVEHQSGQVHLFLKAMKKIKAEAYMIGGDFNTKRYPGQKRFPEGYPQMHEALVTEGFKQLDTVKKTLKVATKYPGPHEPIGLLQKALAALHLNVWSQKLDYLFGSAGLTVVLSTLLPIQGSDHLPVIAHLLLD